jgi:hypothetical protein
MHVILVPIGHSLPIYTANLGTVGRSRRRLAPLLGRGLSQSLDRQAHAATSMLVVKAAAPEALAGNR